MKCKYCNGPVTMEEEFCPFCGALNEPARKHIEDMKRFRMDYQETKEEVMENVKRQSRKHSSILVIAILILLNVILLALHGNMYTLEDVVLGINIRIHEEEYRNTLDRYENERSYEDLRYFYQAKQLYLSDAFDEYEISYETAQDMATIRECIYYLTNEDVNTYTSQGELLSRMANNLSAIYYNVEHKDNSYRKARYEEPHLSVLMDAKAEMELLLSSYCGLTEEDLEKLATMERSDMIVLIGKRVGLYE